MQKRTKEKVSPNDLLPMEARHEDSLVFIIRETHRAFARSLETALHSHSLTTSQWYVLRTLWTDEGLTQAELSVRIGLMTPTTVTTLNQMEKMSLIQRVSHPDDKRKYRIFLTPKARQLRKDLLPIARRVLTDAFEGIPPAKIKLVRSVLRDIQANIAK